MANIAVLGAGSWGTALALQLSRNAPNLYLQPSNFDLMDQQRLQEAAQQADQPVQ